MAHVKQWSIFSPRRSGCLEYTCHLFDVLEAVSRVSARLSPASVL